MLNAGKGKDTRVMILAILKWSFFVSFVQQEAMGQPSEVCALWNHQRNSQREHGVVRTEVNRFVDNFRETVKLGGGEATLAKKLTQINRA